MTDNRNDDAALDALFESAKSPAPLDDAFMAQLLTDATKAAEAHGRSPAARSGSARETWWFRWLPASGLTAATLAGFWIGMVFPSSDLGTSYLTTLNATESELVDFVPTFGVGGLLEAAE